MTMNKDSQEFYRGCLLGVGVGDALGNKLSALTFDEIIKNYGPNGIRQLISTDSVPTEISLDTEMVIIMCEAVLRTYTRFMYLEKLSDTRELSFEHWFATGWDEPDTLPADVTVIKEVLTYKGIESASNGVNPYENLSLFVGVIAGLFYPTNSVFHYTVSLAKYFNLKEEELYPAAALGLLIAYIQSSYPISTAFYNVIGELEKVPNSRELILSMIKGHKAAHEDRDAVDVLEELQPKTAEEIFGAAIFCAFRHQGDFREALIAAVNHSGDSGTLAAITGAILGAYMGEHNIPIRWRTGLSIHKDITQIADDLYIQFEESDSWYQRYADDLRNI